MTGSTSLLEERLERSMMRLAESIEPHVELAHVMRPERSRRVPSSRWMVSAAAASVVLIGGIGLWLGRSDDSPTTAPTSTVGVDPASSPFYLPASLPAGFELTAADRHSANPTTNDIDGFILAVADGSSWRDSIRVLLVDEPIVSTEIVYERSPVELADGTSADLLIDSTNDEAILEWRTPGDDIVRITSGMRTGSTDVERRLMGVADALTIDGSRMTVTGDLPDGLQVVATQPASFSGRSSQLMYTGEDGRGLMVTVTLDPPDGWQFQILTDRLDPITVRGRPGFASEHIYPADLGMLPSRSIGWLERESVLIEVFGDGFTTQQLVAFAANLAPVDEATWLEFSGDVDPSETTS